MMRKAVIRSLGLSLKVRRSAILSHPAKREYFGQDPAKKVDKRSYDALPERNINEHSETLPSMRTMPKNRTLYPGCKESSFVTSLDFLDPDFAEGIPVYRIMDLDGNILSEDPELDPNMLVSIYRTMILLGIFDEVMTEKRMEDKLRFYMKNTGEEAAQVASAAAFDPQDVLFSQYRETGLFLWRGVPVQTMVHQLLGNAGSLDKGRQMCNMYGSRDHNLITQSPPLATQIPQAAGYAFALKQKGSNQCVACYFGEGTASEGDFHAGLNFAAVLNCPVVFFCRNNGYAISTSTQEQYRGDGIASRAHGYGMPYVRVDGNDVLAVYKATLEARRKAMSENRPVLVEAMSYRVAEHSTNVDVDNYRNTEEEMFWSEGDNPVYRCRSYLSNRGLWDMEKDSQLHAQLEEMVRDTFEKAQRELKLKPETLFDDVYDELPDMLKTQREEMKKHVRMYAEHFPLDRYHPMEQS